MSVNADFRDLFAALNDAGAEFLIVGGYALDAKTLRRQGWKGPRSPP